MYLSFALLFAEISLSSNNKARTDDACFLLLLHPSSDKNDLFNRYVFFF